MISNDERCDVAARLRKAIGLTEFAEVLGFNWTDDSDWVWNDVSNFVADLIEPSIPADPGEAGLACVDAFIREHTEKPVDRDALLALAEEMEIDGAGALDDGDWCKPLLVEYASRIRKALGVQDDA